MRPALVTTAVLALLAPLLPAAAAPARAEAPLERVAAAERPARAALGLRVTTRIGGLSHPWDVKQLPSGSLLVTEREPARITLSTRNGVERRVAFPRGSIWVSGETGLMGLEVDPNFRKNRRVYTCSGWQTGGGGHDIRVNAWRLGPAERKLTLLRPLLTGLPTTSGRHGGCRLLIARDGSLLVGTGDAAVGTNPRDLTSLGGKTLRLDRFTGRPWRTNPFVRSDNRRKRYVLTYGHRNVQGLAQRANGQLFSVEHGSFRDDEVNRLVRGGDYGWHPVPGYDESVPMTDQGLPGRQVEAAWSSGNPTVATSGADFVYGRQWGGRSGTLFVAALKAERLFIMRLDRRGKVVRTTVPPALAGRYGRLRTVTQLPNGNVLVCTDGEDGAGRVLLVRPR